MTAAVVAAAVVAAITVAAIAVEIVASIGHDLDRHRRTDHY